MSFLFPQTSHDNLTLTPHPRRHQNRKWDINLPLEIAKTVTDPRIKLQARAIVSDCYKFILDMSTNAGIISDALKYVTHQKEQVNALQKPRTSH